MKKLVHYILIAIMFNWNIAVYAEEENKGCKWEVVEETETYIQESCVGGEDGSFQARIRSKPVDGSIVIVEAPKKNKKKANPIQEFKDKVENAPKIVEKVEKIEEIEEEVKKTEKKIENLKVNNELKEKQKLEARSEKNEIVVEEKDIAEKVEEKVTNAIKNKELEDVAVADVEKPEVKDTIKQNKENAEATEKLVEQAEEKAWAEVDEEQKVDWQRFYELLPRLIVEHEKVKAAEED